MYKNVVSCLAKLEAERVTSVVNHEDENANKQFITRI